MISQQIVADSSHSIFSFLTVYRLNESDLGRMFRRVQRKHFFPLFRHQAKEIGCLHWSRLHRKKRKKNAFVKRGPQNFFEIFFGSKILAIF